MAEQSTCLNRHQFRVQKKEKESNILVPERGIRGEKEDVEWPSQQETESTIIHNLS